MLGLPRPELVEGLSAAWAGATAPSNASAPTSAAAKKRRVRVGFMSSPLLSHPLFRFHHDFHPS
jgi:hypothetical protein